MKIYISGKITGTTDYMERFAAAEEKLVAEGHTPINPAKVNSNLPEGTTWAEYMDVSLVLLGMCTAIYMLKGWEDSRGARVEFNEATKRGYTVYLEG